MRHLTVVVLATAIAVAPAARAQLVVRVQSAGIAVFDAEVTAWSDSGRIAMARSDGAGMARFPDALSSRQVAFITARRLGFGPARLESPAADSVTIELAQDAARLPGVAVTARSLHCPQKSDEDATRLWRSAAARFTAGQDTMPFSYLAATAEESVAAVERGFGDAPVQRLLGGSVAWARNARAFGDPRAYLFGVYHPAVGPSYERWVFPSMHGSAAGLFVSRRFGEQHTFVVLGHSGDVTTLGFCAMSRAGPDIDGELEIGSDTLPQSVRWSVLLPHHPEDAGGDATFGVAHLDGAQYLVAITSSMWHRVRRDRYEQTRYVLDAWRFGHTPEEAWLGTWHANGDQSGQARPPVAGAPR